MKFITENEFAKLLGISRRRMQDIRRKGDIPFIPGQPPLFDMQDVDAFIVKFRPAKAPKQKPVRTEEDKRQAWELRTRFKLKLEAERKRRRLESDET